MRVMRKTVTAVSESVSGDGGTIPSLCELYQRTSLLLGFRFH